MHILAEGRSFGDLGMWVLTYIMFLGLVMIARRFLNWQSSPLWLFTVFTIGYMVNTMILGVFPFASPIHWFG
jgi:hypothetical protein